MKLFSYVLIGALLITLVGCTKKTGNTDGFLGGPGVCFDETCFDVEIADDADERREGLMYRESLDEDEGMLFIFEEPKPRISFWMKNTLIPLDIFRISLDGEVVHMEKNVQPCKDTPCPTYGPKLAETTAKYVLELNAGVADELGVEIGSVVGMSGDE